MEELMETTKDNPLAMLHSSGKFVVPIMHHNARMNRKPDDSLASLLNKTESEPTKLENETETVGTNLPETTIAATISTTATPPSTMFYQPQSTNAGNAVNPNIYENKVNN